MSNKKHLRVVKGIQIRHFMDLDDILNFLEQSKQLGASKVEFRINYAPAGSRDSGPNFMECYKELTGREVLEMEINEKEQGVKALKDKLKKILK